MKQVIYINYQSRVIPIETDAFDQLKNYTESLLRHFSAEYGSEEIMQDIEARIGELFAERLKTGVACITTEDMENIMQNMGRVEDFDREEQGASSKETQATASSERKRFYRSESDKKIAGVCSGIAQYLHIDVVFVRVVFLILFFSFGFGVIPYLIIWLATSSSSSHEIGAVRKKLYRDPDNKLIAGVCSGIGSYLDIEVWIPRVVFLLPLIGVVLDRMDHWYLSESLIPGAFLAYLFAWIIIPEAKTAAEKLEMKGDKIDVTSIKQKIKDEFAGMDKKIESIGKETENFIKQRTPSFKQEASDFIKRLMGGLVKFIKLFARLWIYLILVVLGLSLLIVFSTISFATLIALPFRHWLIVGNVQEYALWISFLFFILLPIVGLLFWFVHRISGRKKTARGWVIGFIILHVVGWLGLVVLVSELEREFLMENTPKTEMVVMTDSNSNEIKLQLATLNTPFESSWLNLDEVNNLIKLKNKDTLLMRNIDITVKPSTDSNCKASWTVWSNGRTIKEANHTASKIKYNVSWVRDTLQIDPWVMLARKDRFRNQRIELVLNLPIGKKFQIDPKSLLILTNPNTLSWDWEEENLGRKSTRFIMETGGLKALD
jgi:phage shock protein PspC (stress-responsive transcriptional regulator)